MVPIQVMAISTTEVMNNNFLCCFLFIVLLDAGAYSETKFNPSDTHGTDFSTVSVEDARAIARGVDGSGMGDNIAAFIEAAMKSGRSDIMGLCWEHSAISSYFSRVFLKMPDSYLKNQLFSIRLRSTRKEWPEESLMRFRSATVEFGEVEFSVGILRKYIPDLPMDYSVMDSREKRLKLADAYDAATGIPIVVEPEAKRVWPPPHGQHQATPTPQSGSRVAGGPVTATASDGDHSHPRGRNFAWFTALAAVFAIAIGWVLTRLRRGKGK